MNGADSQAAAARRERPGGDECAPYYAGYFSLVPQGDIVETLREQGLRHHDFFASLPEDRHDHRYAPGKWSVKEVLGHLLDAEWVFAYRALRFARGDATPLAPMDQDVFVTNGPFARRSLAELLEEYRSLRTATTAMVANLDAEALRRTGVASGCDFTVRSVLYFLAGHELHHVRVVQERYL